MNALQQLVKTVMAEIEGDDIEMAIASAKTRILNDADLQRTILDWAITTLIQSEWRNGRQARWHSDTDPAHVAMPAFGGGITTPSEVLMTGLRNAVNEAKKSLMDWPMMPGHEYPCICGLDQVRAKVEALGHA